MSQQLCCLGKGISGKDVIHKHRNTARITFKNSVHSCICSSLGESQSQMKGVLLNEE